LRGQPRPEAAPAPQPCVLGLSLPANILGVAVFPYSQTVDLNANTDNVVYVFNETSESVYVSLYYDVVPVFAEPVG
jgi:hypothetical protein